MLDTNTLEQFFDSIVRTTLCDLPVGAGRTVEGSGLEGRVGGDLGVGEGWDGGGSEGREGEEEEGDEESHSGDWRWVGRWGTRQV